jgi:hypothetical protein
MNNFDLKKYLVNNSLYEEISPKEKTRITQLLQKALDDPNTDEQTLNRIKNALTFNKLDNLSKDRTKKTSDVLNQYAQKFNLPRTISKYVEASNVKPEYKFQLEKLLQNPDNLITKQSLESKTDGNLLDLVSPKIKKNPLFKEITDYLLTFRARQKGVGESWLLTFGKDPSTTKNGDVNIDGLDLELKDGEAEFSVDTKLTDNKYVHDKANLEFFKSYGTTGKEFVTQNKDRKKETTNLKDIRSQILKLKNYLDGKGKKPQKRSIPSDDILQKYSNIKPEDVAFLREMVLGVINEKKEDPKLGMGLDYSNPLIKKFLRNQKKENPIKLKEQLLKYYTTLYKGASVSIEGLVDYIFDNILDTQKVKYALSTFLLKQYFSKEGFDALMIVNPSTLDYSILPKSYISSLKYGDNLPGNLRFSPKFKRGSDAQNLADGWVNIKFVK